MAQVELVVKSARGLLPMGSNMLADPYVRATLGAQQFKTKKQRHTLTPTWNETLFFSWDGSDWVYVDVFHRVGKTSHDEHMGGGHIDLTPLLEPAVVDEEEEEDEDDEGGGGGGGGGGSTEPKPVTRTFRVALTERKKATTQMATMVARAKRGSVFGHHREARGVVEVTATFTRLAN